MKEPPEKSISFSQLQWDLFEEDPLPYKLWHYTSAAGLSGIVREGGKLHFFFTRSDCLNDYSEGNDVLQCYREACTVLWKNGKINDPFYNGIKDLEMPTLRTVEYSLPDPNPECVHSGLIDTVECDAYICCFSMKEDSLDMWRYYSKGAGGYALELRNSLFGTGELSLSQDPYGLFANIRGCKVIYNTEGKIAFLSDMIIKTYSAFLNDTESTDSMKEAVYILQKYLQTVQYKFKHECFSSEGEYRFVYYLPHEKPDHVQQKLPPVSFRTNNGVVVPYIDWEIEDGAENLENVMLSPFISEEHAEATTKDFLKSRGFLKSNVKKSTLPVRY